MRLVYFVIVAAVFQIPFAIAAADAPAHLNRLTKEKSPYLLQHANNPVDWYPWGPEAFAAAKKENKPIFLSVGYSTCHWCHVMERECFENEAVAKLLNETCIAIKVDREERPDVDRVYMAYVQASTGSGGWPMNVFLTPDLKPFFGGTYFPPEDRDGSPGLKTVLAKVKEAWTTDQAKVETTAGKIADALKDLNQPVGKSDAVRLDEARLGGAFEALKKQYDLKQGGFDPAPKFPQPVNLNFLFHYAARSGDKQAREMALHTLAAMSAGGIHDALGGGFHRYSTDDRWFLPHFEKMLYDQAQIASSYLDAYQVTRDEAYATTARDILNYVLRDLTGKEGQFFSAEDADSAIDAAKPGEKNEGAFYVWSAGEIEKLLGKDAALFEFAYGLEAKGNVERDPRKEFVGKNVLYLANAPEAVATKFGKTVDEVRTSLAASRATLLKVRSQRPHPHLDDKTITAWNGLMISALARGGRVLGEERYLAAAGRAADFIVERLYDPKTQTLYRRYRDGQRDVAGFADDYAFLIQGLLDLYEAGADVRRLKLALELQGRMDALFADAAGGGYFSTVADATLLMRLKEEGDNVEPAASSVAALNLLRLAAITDDKALREAASRTLAGYAVRLDRFPASLPQLLVALDFSLAKPRQIVLAGDPSSPAMALMLREVYAPYLANRVVLFADGGAGQQFLQGRLPFLKDVTAVGGRPTAYVCENYACQLPTSDLAVLRKLLSK
jgi:uncharacterized protein YyaL (SSP411 family)